jgi:diaminopimelate epimerase
VIPTRVLKGHGTENDFVLVPDPDGTLPLSAADVRWLCDRHAGVGADGVLRVVRAEHEPQWADPAAEFAMDYRNADGSIGEMCGNGARVFAAYLAEIGRFDPAGTAVATRGGVRTVSAAGAGQYRVDMGPAAVHDETVTVRAGDLVATGVPVDLPNPHVVVAVTEAQLAALDLRQAPDVDPARPAGQNVEFAVAVADHSVGHRARMRVHERGVGETRSCGTGVCAVVAALATDRAPWRVDVPGGTCTVSWAEAGTLLLTGPAVLTAELTLR